MKPLRDITSLEEFSPLYLKLCQYGMQLYKYIPKQKFKIYIQDIKEKNYRGIIYLGRLLTTDNVEEYNATWLISDITIFEGTYDYNDITFFKRHENL
jgi:hypothetical protein